MKKNYFVIGALVFAIVLIGISYAALSTSLSINGSGSIGTRWGPITITACSCSVSKSVDTSNPATVSCTPTTGGTAATGTITAGLVLPGDIVACTFTVNNAGTLIADVPTFNVNGAPSTITVTNSGKCIPAGKTSTFTTTLTYKSEGSGSATITITPTYKQAASCATT